MAALQSGSELYFHSFVLGYIKDLVRRIKNESIFQLQQAVEDVAATILTDMLRDAVKNMGKCA